MCLYDYLNTKSVDTHLFEIDSALKFYFIAQNHKWLNLYRLNSLSYSEFT